MSVIDALVVLNTVALIMLCFVWWRLVTKVQQFGDATFPRPLLPRVGFRIDPHLDKIRWDAVPHLLAGWALVALVQPNCTACTRLEEDIRRLGNLPYPLYVFIRSPRKAAEPMAKEYTASWPQAVAVMTVPLEPLRSFDNADSFPTLVLLYDGVVKATAHRLGDLVVTSSG